ncbi:TetR family transcriptional regulator C-terminal domain-containing protein [Streptomyces sp. NPDC054796]
MQQQPGSRVADSGGDVAERVRQVIAKAGCSQREFARRIVMDPSKLSRSLGGSRRFTAAELARIADAGSVDAGWLLGSGSAPCSAPDSGSGAGASPEHAPVPDTPNASDAPGTPVPRVRRTAAPGGGRPLQIVRETVRLIAEHGFHAVRVSDIAEACETSTAAIHYHFPGRAELLEAAVRWCMDEDTARRAARIAEAGSAADEMRQLIELQTPHTAQQRRQWLVWLDLWAEAARSTSIGQLHVEYYRQWRTTVADVIRRGVAQGVFRDVDPEFSALRLTSLIDGLAAQVLAAAPSHAGAPDSPDSPGTSPEDMRTALLAYVETELSA